MIMAKREPQDDADEKRGAKKAPAPAAPVDKSRYPGDILRDKKTGRKATFLNEYGTNGRAIIVMPQGMKRSELWDANAVEIIKKAKRPVAAAVVPAKNPMVEEDEREEDDDELPEEDN